MRNRRIRKVLPLLLVQGFVLLTAYYQATGINHLLTALALTPDRILEVVASVGQLPAGEPPQQTRVDVAPRHAARLEAQPDALVVPRCDGVELAIVSEATNREESLISLRRQGEQARLMRRGSRSGSLEVVHIGYDQNSKSPAAWLETERGLCRALLFAGAHPVEVRERGSSAQAQPVGPARERIERIGTSKFIVDRSFVEELLQTGESLRSAARPVPEQSDGSIVGIRLFGIEPDGWVARLGLENGDRLEAVDGHALTSPRSVLQAYARLRRASSLDVRIERRGRKQTLHYEIR